MLRRACRLSLHFATARKRHEIDCLLEAYRGAVNFYVRSLRRNPGALEKETLARLPGIHPIAVHAQDAPERTHHHPTRKTRVLNKWLSMPGARIVQGCALSEKAIVVWVEFAKPEARENGDVIGIDVGIAKLIATNEEKAIGTGWRQISARVRRRRPGRRGSRRARIARGEYINRGGQATALASPSRHRVRRLERIEERKIQSRK